MRDVLSRGLCDPEMQMDLLGDQSQNMTLAEVYKFVEAKEAGKRSASRLFDSHAVEASSPTGNPNNKLTVTGLIRSCVPIVVIVDMENETQSIFVVSNA